MQGSGTAMRGSGTAMQGSDTPRLCHLLDPQQDGHSSQPCRRKEIMVAPGSTSPFAASTHRQRGEVQGDGGSHSQVGSCHLARQAGKRSHLPPSLSLSLISSVEKEEVCCQKAGLFLQLVPAGHCPVQ